MIIPAGFCQVNFFFVGVGLPHGAQVTLGLDHTATAGFDPSDVATAVETSWATAVMPDFYVAAINMNKILVKFGPNTTGPSAELSTTQAGSGGVTADSPNVATLVHKNTTMGGRQGRGRMYIPGAASTIMDADGVINPASVAQLQGDVDDFYTQLTSFGLLPVVLRGDTDPPPPITTPEPISGFTVDGTVATQRRRLRR